MLRNMFSKCATVYMVAVVLLALHLTQSAASVLRKTETRNGLKGATASGIRVGVIVFGNGPKNASSGDDASYQADFPGFKGKVLDFKEAQWKRMSPSLLCGSDQMKFRAIGSPVKFFGLDQDPPMPLSHVPSNCGYNMQKNPFGLVINVPYHGCNVVQEDENYNLPLRWNGVPVALKCPIPQDHSATEAPQISVLPNEPMPETTAAPQDPVLPQMPSDFPYFFQLLWNKSNQPSTPVSPQDQSLWNAYLSFLQQPLQTKAQSTTTAPPPPPQDPPLWNDFLSYLQQLLQNQGQSTAASPLQDPVLLNSYISYLQQILYNQDQATAPPTDPVQLPPHYLYQLLQQQYKPKETAAFPPNIPQNPLASLYGSLYKNLPTAAPTSTDSSTTGLYAFNPYLFSLYTGKVSKDAPATTPLPAGYSWYSQSVNVPQWFQGRFPAADTASYKPQYDQIPLWYMQPTTTTTTTTTTTKVPEQMHSVEVSKLQTSK